MGLKLNETVKERVEAYKTPRNQQRVGGRRWRPRSESLYRGIAVEGGGEVPPKIIEAKC